MKKLKIILKLSVMFTVVMLTTACFFGTSMSKTVTPSIRAIGIPDVSAVDSITLTATDANGVIIGETTLSSLTTVPDQISLALPPGNDITFDLTVNMGAASTINSYKGTSIPTDISSDSITVTISMGIESTKLVVPDYLNQQITQFNNISGTGKYSLNQGTITSLLSTSGYTLSTFAPYDIDYDNQGRIYIANYAGSTESGIIRIDNITGMNPIYISRDSISGLKTVVVDRNNELIYYTDGTTVYRNNLDGTTEAILINISGTDIAGLALDTEGGFLYYVDSPDGNYIYKYRISDNTIVNSSLAGSIITPWDILFKNGKLYVANLFGASGDQILEFSTLDLSLIGQYGNPTSVVNISQGKFYGPRKFVAKMNSGLTIIDDYNDGDPYNGIFNFDKIIQMDNIQGDGWTTLPADTNNDGQTLFNFYTQDVYIPN